MKKLALAWMALLLAWPQFASAAPNNTCTITGGTCDLNAITDATCGGTGSITCVGGDTTPGADDLFVVEGGANEIQQFDIGTPSSGTMALTWNGLTATIAYNIPNYIELQRQVIAAWGLERGDIQVQRGMLDGGPRIRFTGNYACQDVPSITASCASLVGAGGSCSTPVLVQTGAAAPASPGALTISGNFTFDATTGTALQVECGSSLTIATPGVVVTLPAGTTAPGYTSGTHGLIVESGGLLTVKGGLLSLGTSTPTVETTRSALTLWSAGQVTPCATGTGTPTIDCAANPSVEGLVYDTRYMSSPSTGVQAAPYYANSINAITANTDVLHYIDPSYGAGSYVPMDRFAFYDITGKKNTAPYFIKYDVQHGSVNQYGWPLVRRQIKTTTLSADAERGAWSIPVAAGFIGATEERVYSGRCVRFGTGGVPLGQSYSILHVRDGGDTIKLLDTRGVREKHLSGETVWIDNCVVPGDTFEIIRPVRITSATTAAFGDSTLLLEGSASIRDAVIERIGRLELRAGAYTLENTWIKDAVWNNADGSAILLLGAKPVTIGPGIAITGGSDICGAPCEDNRYGIQWQESGLVTIRDSLFREAGDDTFLHHSVESGVADQSDGVSLLRVVAQWKSDSASSGAGLEVNAPGRTPRIDIEGAIFQNDVSDDGVNTVINVVGHAGNARGVAAVGNASALWNANIEGHFVGSNFLYAGNIMANASSAGNYMIFPLSSNFVARDNINSASSSLRMMHTYASSVENGVYLRNVLRATNPWRDPEYGAKKIENIAIVDTDMDVAAAVISHFGGATNVARFNRVTIGNTTGFTPAHITRFLYSAGPEYAHFSNILLTGARGADSVDAFNQSSADVLTTDYTGSFCFFNNKNAAVTLVDMSSGSVATNLATVIGAANLIRNLDPQYYNEADAQVWTPVGGRVDATGCGADRGAGIKTTQWFHKSLGIVPEYLGELDGLGGAGGGAWPRAY